MVILKLGYAAVVTSRLPRSQPALRVSSVHYKNKQHSNEHFICFHFFYLGIKCLGLFLCMECSVSVLKLLYNQVITSQVYKPVKIINL